MTPDTIARLYDLLENNPPRVNIDAKVFRQLLDRAALKGSAEICNGDLVAQRDAEIERADYALKAIATAALFLQTARENLEHREARQQAPELAGAPGA